MRQFRKNIAHWANVGGQKCYFKSLFERRYACLLEILKRGKQIKGWQYEPKRFRFFGPNIPKGLKGKTVGATVYTPDFKVIELNGSITYHETKGYLDNRDIAKMRCFKTYYPDERLVFVINGMPQGKTAKSRAKKFKLDKIKKLGYRIYDVRNDFRKYKSFLDSMLCYS